MQISLHDYENARVIIATVPQYLIDTKADQHDIAGAIITALGLSDSSTDYMFSVDDDTLKVYQGPLKDLTADFEADALEALADHTA